MVNIVLITDNNYVKYTAITITSIIDNKNEDTVLNINILSNELSDTSISLLKSLEIANVKINIIDAYEYIKKFKNIVQDRHVTYTALLKFYIPIIFDNIDKILYFDSDLIIQSDLSELYNHDLSGYYAEVVLDIQNYNKNHLRNIKLKNKQYFNSGMLLLNLDLLRKNNITDKLVYNKLNNNTYCFMDQDTLNLVIGDKVRFISYKYNFSPELIYNFNCSLQDLKCFYNEAIPDNLKELYDDCFILHYGGRKKAWDYKIDYISDIYKKYWELSPIKEEFPNLKVLPNKVKNIKYTFLERIFSIKVSQNYLYKILTILGTKIKFKRG